MILQIGSIGFNVSKLQFFLKITADGYFGNNTALALKEWQTNNGLTPDGIAGDLTIAKMGLNLSTPSIANMKTSTNGVEIIEKFEGCILHAYFDPGTGGLPITIGYGNTEYENGSKIKLGDTLTQQQANALLINLLPKYEAIIRRNINVNLNQNQFDALLSFVWNTGGSKTLFSLINSNDAGVYNFWTTNYIKGGGVVLPGLVSRRKSEADLFINV